MGKDDSGSSTGMPIDAFCEAVTLAPGLSGGVVVCAGELADVGRPRDVSFPLQFREGRAYTAEEIMGVFKGFMNGVRNYDSLYGAKPT